MAKKSAAEKHKEYITRPSGLMVDELPADEWDVMFDIISIMESEERATFVMNQCRRVGGATPTAAQD